jgi:hypothetical protein
MALFGHGAMSDLSPLLEEERKFHFEAVRSAFDPVSDVDIAGHRPTILLYEHSISRTSGRNLSSEQVERRAAILAADVAALGA